MKKWNMHTTLHQGAFEREPTFPYVLAISAVVHLFLISFVALPYYFDPGRAETLRNSIKNKTLRELAIRDVIVNINPDGETVETDRTLLSDVDSAAKGHLTREKGDNWLNNSLSFRPQSLSQGSTGGGGARSTREELLLADKKVTYTVTLFEERDFIPAPEPVREPSKERKTAQEKQAQTQTGNDAPQQPEVTEWGRIPDKRGITLENAIYYSNTRRFSFNTKKFSDFEYFRRMKQKIANNWFPPIMANSLSTSYTPGRTSMRVIASQEVRLYFVLNRQGDVLRVELVDSRGNRHLDESCMDAIRKSRNFGPVPKDIPGEEVVIPFIFGYYVR